MKNRQRELNEGFGRYRRRWGRLQSRALYCLIDAVRQRYLKTEHPDLCDKIQRAAAHKAGGSLISAFGIKRAIRGFDTLEALGGFRDRPSNREIIGLAFDY